MPTREQLEGLLEREPDDVFLRYSLAMVLRREGHDDAALDAFDRCLTLDPDYVPAAMQKGLHLQALGETDDARAALEAALTIARRVGDAHAAGEITEFLSAL